jgi:hypothetical protein
MDGTGIHVHVRSLIRCEDRGERRSERKWIAVIARRLEARRFRSRRCESQAFLKSPKLTEESVKKATFLQPGPWIGSGWTK